MESLKELYKIGPGPSSSHTLAPQRACLLFKETFPDVVSYEVDLYGSLSLTGKGHHTDKIIEETFAPKRTVVNFKEFWVESFPNGLEIRGYDLSYNLVGEWTVYSLGGGSIEVKGMDFGFQKEIYPESSFEEIKQFCKENGLSLVQYPFHYEKDLLGYLNIVVEQMLQTVQKGLDSTGILPGRLKMPRIAKSLFLQARSASEEEKDKLLLYAYAYAASEENAAGGTCVTAPTLGASGVLAALIYYYYYQKEFSKNALAQALALAGVFGNLVKENASISGALGGCQAEIGTACSMGSALVAYLEGLSLKQIEYAAEIGIEHHLGLTCDPVGGYVIIPCIERNAVATLRAIDAALMAKYVGAIKENRVHFDNIVNTMNYTGKKIPLELRETSLGGLALEINLEGSGEEE